MWKRSDLKIQAKAAIRKNYWAAVFVAFIVMLVSASSYSSNAQDAAQNAASSSQTNYTYDEMDEFAEQPDMDFESEDSSFDQTVGNLEKIARFNIFDAIWKTFSITVVIILILAMLGFGIFVGNVLIVGGMKFFIENRQEKPGIGCLLYGFKCGHYMNIVKTIFLMHLYIVLWTFLLIVPGIIKSYEYRMIPYILAEHPEMETREIFALSREMMMGEKMNAFVLDFSFVPWILLSALTLGIAGIFYVNPYIHATDAELYAVLSDGGMPESPYLEI